MIPKISVIIPLYNKEKVIFNTVTSVLNQTYKDFEIIIVDDGSTDNSIESISKIKDNRLRVLSKDNGGVSSARNFGLKNAKSEYIYFLDADDLILPDCLSSYAELIEKYNNHNVFVANLKIRDQNSDEYLYCKNKQYERIVKKPFKAYWNKEIYPRPGAMIIKKVCLKKIGYFNTEISRHEDTEFVMRMLENFEIVYAPFISFIYVKETNHESTKIHSFKKEFGYYIDLKNKSFYEKLILSEIFNSYYKRRKLTDTYAKNYLLKQYCRHIGIIIISRLLRLSKRMFMLK